MFRKRRSFPPIKPCGLASPGTMMTKLASKKTMMIDSSPAIAPAHAQHIQM